MDFADLADHRVNIKEKIAKYPDVNQKYSDINQKYPDVNKKIPGSQSEIPGSQSKIPGSCQRPEKIIEHKDVVVDALGMISKSLEKRLGKLELERIETIQTTVPSKPT